MRIHASNRSGVTLNASPNEQNRMPCAGSPRSLRVPTCFRQRATSARVVFSCSKECWRCCFAMRFASLPASASSASSPPPPKSPAPPTTPPKPATAMARARKSRTSPTPTPTPKPIPIPIPTLIPIPTPTPTLTPRPTPTQAKLRCSDRFVVGLSQLQLRLVVAPPLSLADIAHSRRVPALANDSKS
eukprot:3785570-Rhodomonas_salina.2